MPELRAISGVGSKGPACFLLQIGERNLLLDLGRGPDEDRAPVLHDLPPIDAIIFSHGHADHTGGLDLWPDLGAPPLFASRPTIALARHPGLQQARPLEGLGQLLGVALLTGPAGHAPGAVWMRIGGKGGLLYSGDACAESPMFCAAPYPPAAAMVIDASYGVADQPLSAQIEQIVSQIDGPVLLPCPAGGRGLEIAATLLQRGLPVSICAEHRRVVRVLRDHADWMTPQGRNALSLLDQAADLHADSPIAGSMIAAGPNAERGVAHALAGRIRDAGGARIIFTGHVAAGSPAQDLIDQGHAVFSRWNVHPTLSQASAMVASAAPQVMLAAFCAASVADDLRVRTGWPIARGERLVW